MKLENVTISAVWPLEAVRPASSRLYNYVLRLPAYKFQHHRAMGNVRLSDSFIGPFSGPFSRHFLLRVQ